MSNIDIKEAVKRIVQQYDSEAEIILYGSRARGDATAESDWDFLILLSNSMTRAEERAMCRALYEIEWDHGEVIVPIIHTRAEWEEPRRRATPFNQVVGREGITV